MVKMCSLKHKRTKYILLLVCAVALLAAIGGLCTGIYFSVKGIHDSTCKVIEFGHRNCFESKGHLFMDQYFAIDNNRTAFVSCGPVLDCQTSPCDRPIHVNNSYRCEPYSADLWRLGNWPLNYDFIIGMYAFGLLFTLFGLIWSIGMIIEICMGNKNMSDDVDMYMDEKDETTKLEE